MVYELKDLQRKVTSIKSSIGDMKGILFRLHLNADSGLEAALIEAEDRLEEFEDYNLEQIKKELE